MIVEIFLQSNEKYHNYQNIITTFYQFSPITATAYYKHARWNLALKAGN